MNPSYSTQFTDAIGAVLGGSDDYESVFIALGNHYKELAGHPSYDSMGQLAELVEATLIVAKWKKTDRVLPYLAHLRDVYETDLYPHIIDDTVPDNIGISMRLGGIENELMANNLYPTMDLMEWEIDEELERLGCRY